MAKILTQISEPLSPNACLHCYPHTGVLIHFLLDGVGLGGIADDRATSVGCSDT